jgi:hypothetical protein
MICTPGSVAGMVTPKGSMSTEGEALQVSVLPYRCWICAPLVMRQMSNFGKFQDTDRFLSYSCKYAKDPSTKKNLERFSVY